MAVACAAGASAAAAARPPPPSCLPRVPRRSQLGPMGKVWESGAVQVVQFADSLPGDVHPRARLPGELAGRIGEAIYLPVYDRSGQGAPAPALALLLGCWGVPG